MHEDGCCTLSYLYSRLDFRFHFYYNCIDRCIYLNLSKINSKRNVLIITLLFPFAEQKYIYSPVSKVHAGSFRVSIIHQTLTWTTGSLTCICDHSCDGGWAHWLIVANSWSTVACEVWLNSTIVPSRGNPAESMCDCFHFHCPAGQCDLMGPITIGTTTIMQGSVVKICIGHKRSVCYVMLLSRTAVGQTRLIGAYVIQLLGHSSYQALSGYFGPVAFAAYRIPPTKLAQWANGWVF